ncbi:MULTISPECIES: Sec-independent protein translocase protein TatB [Massilia]|jgi:sec-independent protein translocase protein TatB|uniref:Sec-independent protein translocase protein TatB n=2 Tax=Massilia TaxID=149698 RepID=A0A7X3K5S3_9BURK|nr:MULTISPECIES: Sec-independent protein translocase protein TatB [Telluria group]KQY14842.1 preprotein translocase [Massilia sp. Root133]KQZ43661.1 preprotein translocase [Massilia sp. Root1485]MDN4044484.1 Sec-independent protein translocase protein TatB [Massilia sp. YIM B02787]MVW59194.1 Sec-independent protein translocase subunit TatB [Telluria cellulosilytica]
MIDLGLTKLAIIGAVALVVIGPEKLPKVARMAGTLYGRAQRYLHDVKSEVSREIEMEELRNLHKDIQDSAQSFKSEVETFKSEVENTVSTHMDEVESAWRGDTAVMPTTASTDDIERKARDFRRKKLAKTSSMPAWYKNRQGTRQHVLSGAARVRKFRPGATSNTKFF